MVLAIINDCAPEIKSNRAAQLAAGLHGIDDPAGLLGVADAVAGDVVLMSPASAAFDQFKNFMVRGNHFKKMIMEL